MASSIHEFEGTDRFTIEDRIGTGATGVVYRARDSERDRVVALKLLRRYDPMALYRFKQEFRALSDVAHPNLVSLYELVSLGDQWFFTMELVDGVDFLTYVRGFSSVSRESDLRADTIREPDNDDTADTMSLSTVQTTGASLTAPSSEGSSPSTTRRSSPHIAPPATDPEQLERLRKAVTQLVDGVRALHDAGQLHRDLKPSNVLVTSDDRVVILDFGVVAELTPTGTTARETRVVGTPAYMAPEQGAGVAAGEASDWYSVGVMMYEALSGRRPFVGAAKDVIAAKQTQTPRPIEEFATAVPPELRELCFELLDRNPAARPDADEILDRLGGEPRDSQPRIPTRSPEESIHFVGRGAHIEMLRAAYAVAQTGSPRVAFVHGSSGMGKTALVTHFLDELREGGEAVVLAGRCYERESVPYKALDDLIDALSRHLLELPRRQVWDLMPPDVHALARLFPVLRRVEAVLGAERKGVESLHPNEVRRRAFGALRELLDRLARRAPLVLFIDDVQWGDADSASLLSHVIAGHKAPPLLLLCAYRREDTGTSALLQVLLPAQRSAVSLAVDPLTSHETEQLALSHLGYDNDVTKSLARSIAREAGGNPFFVQELVRWIKSHDDLVSIGHNVTLDAVLASRVSELAAPARSLLEVVAVAGRPVSQAVVMRAANLGDDEHVALSTLRSALLVHTRGARDRDEIECLHDRIREAVVLGLSNKQQRERHRRLASIFEASGEGDAETLSMHFEGAGDLQRASQYCVAAADAAMEALAFERAVDLYERAIKLSQTSSAQHGRLRGALGDALAHAGRRADAAAMYREASLLADSAAERFDLARRAAEAYLNSGHVDEGVRALEEVLASVDLKMPRTRKQAMRSFVLRRAWIRMRGLRFRERDASQLTPHQLSKANALWTASVGFAMCDTMLGADFQARHLLAALRSGERSEIARGLAVEASYRSVMGRRGLRRARKIAAKAMTLAETIGDPLVIAWAHGAHAIVSYQVGQFEDTRSRCELAADLLAGRHGASWELATLQQYRIWALYYMGELDEMSRRVFTLAREARERGDLYSATNLTTGIPSAAWLVRDDAEGAVRGARENMERWSRQGFHLQHYWYFIGKLHAHLYAGEIGTALRDIDETWRPLTKSFLLRVVMVRIETHHGRARVAIRAAAEGRDRDAMIKQALADSRALEKEGSPFSDAIATLQRAAIASLHDQQDEAKRLLETAAASFDDCSMKMYAAAARRRLGELVGGDEGKQLVDRSNWFMREQRVRNPDAFTNYLAPGFSN